MKKTKLEKESLKEHSKGTKRAACGEDPRAADVEQISDTNCKNGIMRLLGKMGWNPVKYGRIKGERDQGWGLGVELLGEKMIASCEKLAGKNLDRQLKDEMRTIVIQRLWPLFLRKEKANKEFLTMLREHKVLQYWQKMANPMNGAG